MDSADQSRAGKPSASYLPRISCCPGSHRMEAEHGTRVESDDSRSGDSVHSWLSLRLKDQSTGGITLTAAQDSVARRCESAARLLVEHVFPGQAYENLWKFTEQRLWVTAGKRKLGSAKLDFAVADADRAMALDFKSLYADHGGSEENLQLRCQAVALWQATGRNQVLVAKVQPNVEATPVLSTYERTDLEYAYEQICSLFRSATAKNAILRAGPHCSYCSANGNCSVATEWAVLKDRGMDMVVADEAGPAARTIDIKQALEIWKRRNVVGRIMDACAQRLGALPEEEKASLGLSWEPGRELHDYSDLASIYSEVESLGLNGDIFQSCLTLVKSKLVAAVAAKAGSSEAEADRQLFPILARHRTTRHAEPSLTWKEPNGQQPQLSPPDEALIRQEGPSYGARNSEADPPNAEGKA